MGVKGERLYLLMKICSFIGFSYTEAVQNNQAGKDVDHATESVDDYRCDTGRHWLLHSVTFVVYDHLVIVGNGVLCVLGED